LSKPLARRFLLAHQHLLPPRRLSGKAGILHFIQHIGCIQFDPIDVVGRNPELVLQARVRDHRSQLLQELLYTDRLLVDGWDKLASIYLTSDWPYFARHRTRMRSFHGRPDNPAMQIASSLIERIRREGPLSSIDVAHDQKVLGGWGRPTRLVREAFEVLNAMGDLGVHHRVGTRRFFDLKDRLIPAEVLAQDDPHPEEEAYQAWHVLRRVRTVGLANPRATEYWLGIPGLKSQARRKAYARLVERGELIAVQIEGVPGRTFFLASADLPTLEAVRSGHLGRRQAALIAPLDNLVSDRQLLRWLFDFQYTWEVYTPQAKRRYGYYVLPVLYGDRFVARVDPSFDRKSRVLTLNNWWWEPGILVSAPMHAALQACLRDFLGYLQAEGLRLGSGLRRKPQLGWLRELAAS
jgi:uncharacterized protein YcaQ